MAATEMTDDMVVQGARAAVRIALAKNQARGVSSVAYDRKTKTIYEIRSDGQRVPIQVGCDDWQREKIETLTGITDMERRDLNHRG